MVYNFNVKFYNGPVTIDTIQNEYLLLYVIYMLFAAAAMFILLQKHST